MKWVKRILLLVTIALVVSLVIVARMARSIPDFVTNYTWTEEERSAIAMRVVNKMNEMRNMAAQASVGETASRPTTAILGRTVDLTEEELNAFLVQWSDKSPQAVRDRVSDPRIYLHEGQVVIAVTAKGVQLYGYFRPRIDDDGLLRLRMEKLQAGTLPVPAAAVGGLIERARVSLLARLPAWQKNAKFAPAGGVANDAAVAATMALLMLSALDGRPADAVMYLPTENVIDKPVPVRLTELVVEDKTITLTAQPLSPAERQELLEHIRKPYLAAPAQP